MKKILTTAIILMASLAQAEVVITEVMADNGESYPNAAGEAMDWLELYNPGATPVDMTVGGKKKVLAIRTNLWFDRSNDHADVEYEGIGGAKFVE